MRFGLTQDTINKINNVFENYPQIDKAILYGSRAKGIHKNGSDIDITLLGENLNISILNKIYHDIDDLLLPYTCDISISQHINNPDLLEHIDRVGDDFYVKQ